jgi:hypothetical protein
VQNWRATNFDPDTRVTGPSLRKSDPDPTNPLGTIFISLTNSRIQNSTQTRLLIEENPTGSQVTGTHCHLYMECREHCSFLHAGLMIIFSSLYLLKRGASIIIYLFLIENKCSILILRARNFHVNQRKNEKLTTTVVLILWSKIPLCMLWFQLRVIVKNSFLLQSAHSYSIWTPKINLLFGNIYKIICSIFHIKTSTSELWSWSILGGIKIFDGGILIMIKYRSYKIFLTS